MSMKNYMLLMQSPAMMLQTALPSALTADTAAGAGVVGSSVSNSQYAEVNQDDSQQQQQGGGGGVSGNKSFMEVVWHAAVTPLKSVWMRRTLADPPADTHSVTLAPTRTTAAVSIRI